MALWLTGEPLVLASGSRIRQMLLAAAGIPVEGRPANLDERAVESQAASPAPGAIAGLLARAKAGAVAKLNPGRLTLGADQMLALGAERFLREVVGWTASRQPARKSSSSRLGLLVRLVVHDLVSATGK